MDFNYKQMKIFNKAMDMVIHTDQLQKHHGQLRPWPVQHWLKFLVLSIIMISVLLSYQDMQTYQHIKHIITTMKKLSQNISHKVEMIYWWIHLSKTTQLKDLMLESQMVISISPKMQLMMYLKKSSKHISVLPQIKQRLISVKTLQNFGLNMTLTITDSLNQLKSHNTWDIS